MKKICLLLLSMFLFVGCGYSNVHPKEITTCHQAISLAEEAVKNKFGNRFDGYTTYAALSYHNEYRSNIWLVEFYPPNTTVDDENFLVGGGDPRVEIDPSTGEIISCLLTK